MSDRGSESENPAIPVPDARSRAGPGRTRTGGRTSWTCRCSTSTRPASDPMGEDFDYAEEFKTLDVDALKRDIVDGDDDVAGLVARRLRPLRAALHPDDVARRRHLPHRATAGAAAASGAQRFAPLNSWPDNAEPRQGPPAALAGQAEVRPEDLLGRPPGLRRQLRAGVDGVQDVRLRLRATGHLGARRDLLGPRGHVARRRALQRRPGARRSVRRRADGPDLREPGGAERQPGSAGVRPGHPRDLPPHGDGRRGDRRAHRRRPHVRQVPRRRRAPTYVGPEPEGCPVERAGPRLEEHLRHRQGRRHDHQRARGRLDQQPDQVGQRLPRQPVRLRLGADDEPRRREAVDARRIPRPRAPCPTPTIRRSGTRR